jgi:hypothetical protein
MMRKAWLLVALVLIAGCDRNRQQLETALTEAKTVSAEKDSLLNEMLETTKLMSDINSELAKARVGVSPVAAGERTTTPSAEDRQIVLGKIREVITRLNESEAQLDKNKARIEAMTKKDRRLLAQIETFKETIAELRATTERQQTEYTAIIETQKQEIASLTEERDTVRAYNVRLEGDKTALADTVSTLTEYKNTVYVAAGSKKELLDKGLAVNEGSKFLFFGGKKLLPARSLTPEGFETINKVRDNVIPLPKPDRSYRIVSRHSPQYLVEGSASKDGKVKGELHIASPEEFWAVSKYLILVED